MTLLVPELLERKYKLVPELLLSVDSAVYRKRWLHLKPESCGKWVKNDGKVEPLCYVLGLGGCSQNLFMIYDDEIVSKSYILVCDLNLLCSKCNIIGDPKRYLLNETPLAVRTKPTIPDEDHANSHHVEESPTTKQKQDHVIDTDDVIDIDDVEEPPTSIQNPSTSTQKCSSRSPTKKKRKLQSSDDAISLFGKDVFDVMKMMVEITNDVRVLYKKLDTLEEDVSKLTRMTMEKSKEEDMGACIEKLDKMGWGAEEPIYDTALLLFGQSADYRKLWLHLKPESCGKWVKNAGKSVSSRRAQVEPTRLFAQTPSLIEAELKLLKMILSAPVLLERLYKLVPEVLLSVESADYRKCWLHLKAESCGKWVNNAGKVEQLRYVLGLGRMHDV
ncbi:hypothetical protein Tco_0232614 [Tanacetum coccineum]